MVLGEEPPHKMAVPVVVVFMAVPRDKAGKAPPDKVMMAGHTTAQLTLTVHRGPAVVGLHNRAASAPKTTAVMGVMEYKQTYADKTSFSRAGVVAE